MTADQEKLLRNIEETRVGLGLAPPQTASHPAIDALRFCPCCCAGAIWCERTGVRYLYATTTRTHEWKIACGDGCVSTGWTDSQAWAAKVWNRRVGTT